MMFMVVPVQAGLAPVVAFQVPMKPQDRLAESGAIGFQKGLRSGHDLLDFQALNGAILVRADV
ncbi:MAG: hypothetical protein ABL878_18575 [Burkholderiales bacterium]